MKYAVFSANRPRFARAAARVIVLVLGALCLSSCYVIEQGSGYLTLQSKAVPADRVLADPKAPEASKELLRRARRIREFAVADLGLRDTKNYSALVETDSDTLAFVVSACDSVSFSRYLWKYPVVGALPYQGFFTPQEADQEAERLKKKGYDVIVRQVDAFSTLGWFADPLFSFMSKYDDAELAETIIHELAHATVFVKKAGDFNEEFATFVGRQGSLAYLAHVYGEGSSEAQAALQARHDAEAFADFLRSTAEVLRPVYASDLSREEKLSRKSQIISARAQEYKTLAPSVFQGESYRNFPMDKVNNAYLDLYRLYEGEPELYQEYYERLCHSDLAEFVRRVSVLASKGGDPKELMKRELISQ